MESEMSLYRLVDVALICSDILVDIRYSSDENFMGRAVYPTAKLILTYGTAKKLIKANNDFKKLGYQLKVLDGYRPISVQKMMWELLPDENFVAPVTRGSVHNRGAAVDVTLMDINGNEMKMPSRFDDFSEKAFIHYSGSTNEERQNMNFLAEIMVKNGFVRIDSEWWHFNDSDYLNYPILDIAMNTISD